MVGGILGCISSILGVMSVFLEVSGVYLVINGILTVNSSCHMYECFVSYWIVVSHIFHISQLLPVFIFQLLFFIRLHIFNLHAWERGWALEQGKWNDVGVKPWNGAGILLVYGIWAGGAYQWVIKSMNDNLVGYRNI
jgi:hypothetical protein